LCFDLSFRSTDSASEPVTLGVVAVTAMAGLRGLGVRVVHVVEEGVVVDVVLIG
jgi:hypothetical protein